MGRRDTSDFERSGQDDSENSREIWVGEHCVVEDGFERSF